MGTIGRSSPAAIDGEIKPNSGKIAAKTSAPQCVPPARFRVCVSHNDILLTQKYIGFFSDEFRIDGYTFQLGPIVPPGMGSMPVVSLVDGYCERGLSYLLSLAARYGCACRSNAVLLISAAPPFFAVDFKRMNSLVSLHADLTCRLGTPLVGPGKLTSKCPMEGRSE
jgi:hypothetical protein